MSVSANFQVVELKVIFSEDKMNQIKIVEPRLRVQRWRKSLTT